jgi:hypothetical protein
MHPTRRVEASEATIAELNILSDEDIVKALLELSQPKPYVQGGGGNKLTMRIILSTLNDSTTFKTDALLDCGCTSSTMNTRYVQRHNLPTRKLPRPIPVYNADGTLNRNGCIKETVTLHMVVQDHTEKITFAVSDIGHTDVYIGHEWLKHHNPEVDWRKLHLYMNRCPPSCQFIDMHEIDEEDEETLVDEEEICEESLKEGDHLFFFNADSFLEDEGITIARCD